MSQGFQWDQSAFNENLKKYLQVHEQTEWPRILNKKAFYVALAAFRRCPRVTDKKIAAELQTKILAKSQTYTGERLISTPMGFVIASKRASRNWPRSDQFRKQVNREAAGQGTDYESAWRDAVADEYKRMVGHRKASEQFLRGGFASIIYALAGPAGLERSSAGAQDTHFRGRVKGTVPVIAKEGDMKVVIVNAAHSKTENRGGFNRIGGAALQWGFDTEMAKMEEYLAKELEPGMQKFNEKER